MRVDRHGGKGWRELCAQRLTRTLARQPRKRVSRAYLASLPKRDKIIVSPEEFGPLPERVAKGPAKTTAGEHGQPATARRKDRLRPSKKTEFHREGRAMLAKHLHAQQDRCAYCNCPLEKNPIPAEWHRKATLDHVVPRSSGGAHSLENTVAACLGCNSAKSALSRDEFMANRIDLRRKVGC